MRDHSFATSRCGDAPATGLSASRARIATSISITMLYVLLAYGQDRHRHTSAVEQSVAGVRVGERLSKVRIAHPNLRAEHGVWTMALGRNCKLELVAEDTKTGDPRVTVVTLERIDPTDVRADETCDAVKAGSGLAFGADLENFRSVYPGMSRIGPANALTLYRLDNGRECLARSSSILRSMFVYWSSRDHRVTSISVEGSHRACEEYRTATAK